MAPLLEAKQQLAAKVEVTEGTAETLAAANAIEAKSIEFDPDIEVEELELRSAFLGTKPGVSGRRMARMTFETPLRGSGAAGTAPEIAALLKACGFEETVNASTSVEYDPLSAAIPSLTMAKYVDGKRYLMAGARGSFEITLPAGRPTMLAFEFLGTAIGDSDVALLSPTYQDILPVAFQNASFTLGGYAAIVEEIKITLNNQMELRDSVNAAQGYLSAIINNRNPQMTLNPEDVLVATEDFWSDWESGAELALTATLGATAGNICTITAPKVQYIKLGQAERKGYGVQEIAAALRMDSGNDELKLVFT